MNNLAITGLTFVLLSAVSLLCMYLHSCLAERHRDADTAAAVAKIANIFVVITSLVFGLLITSSKSTFEAIDHNIHNYATQLILLDRILRNYGDDAAGARGAMKAYVQEAIAHPAQTDELEYAKSDTAGHALDLVGTEIDALRPPDPAHERMLANAQNYYRDAVRQRWTIVEQSEGALPTPIIGMLIAWLTIIFASYGYRAPKNAVVVSMLLVSALLISASLYLVLDMNIPFRGPIRISYEPYHRALAEMQALHIQQAAQIRAFRDAWKEAGHARTPRVSVSRSIFALTDDRDRAYFGRGRQDADTIGFIDEKTRAVFGRSYAAEPDILVEQLKKDAAIAEADTLLLTIPNQLGVEYNVHVLEAIPSTVAPAVGWR